MVSQFHTVWVFLKEQQQCFNKFFVLLLNSNENNTLINIEQATQLLDMDVEIFSTEPAMQFAEHFIIKHGNITLQETVSYQELFPDSYASKEMFEKTTNIHITPEQWEQDIITIGGFDSTEFTI